MRLREIKNLCKRTDVNRYDSCLCIFLLFDSCAFAAVQTAGVTKAFAPESGVCLIATLTRDKCNSVVSDAAYRFLDLPDATPSCSSQVKLLVRAKAKTRRSPWQIPCHNVTPAITPVRHPHLLQICGRFDKNKTVLAGG